MLHQQSFFLAASALEEVTLRPVGAAIVAAHWRLVLEVALGAADAPGQPAAQDALAFVPAEDGGTASFWNLRKKRMYSQRPFEWYMTRLPKLKISWRRGTQYTSPVSLGGRHKIPWMKILYVNDFCYVKRTIITNYTHTVQIYIQRGNV